MGLLGLAAGSVFTGFASERVGIPSICLIAVATVVVAFVLVFFVRLIALIWP